MGANRPPSADVARRLAAAIAVAGTMLLGLVVGAGPAAAGPRLAAGESAGATLVAAPAAASLQATGDLFVMTASAARGSGDTNPGWAEPATISVLLAAPVGFFVGLTDTSDVATTDRPLRQSRGRSPPAAAAPVPR